MRLALEAVSPCDAELCRQNGFTQISEEPPKRGNFSLHLVVTPDGVPVSFDLLRALYHDLTPMHELMEPAAE